MSQGFTLSSIATKEVSKPISPNITAPLPKRNTFLNQTVRNTHSINVCDAMKNENTNSMYTTNQTL